MADLRRSPHSRSFRRALSLAVVLVAAQGAAWAQSGPAPVPDPQPSPPASRAQKAEGLSADLMYRLLVGDVALQRGEPAIAARAYYEAARETRDPVFARRATEIAVAARQRSLAIESARLWSELDPAAARPRQVIAAYASGAGATPEASVGSLDLKAHLEKLLAETAATNPPAVGEAFLQLNPLLAQEADKTATYRLVTALAQPYPNVAEA
jgi:hypothetical protein